MDRPPVRTPLPWTLLAVVFLVALGVRLLYVSTFRGSPFFEGLLVDARWHHDWARAWAENGFSLGEQAFFRAPLYPAFVALVYQVLGVDLTALRVVQAFLGALTAAGIAAAGFRLGGRTTAGIAGGIAALYGPFLFFDGEVLIPVLLLPLLAWSLALLLDSRPAPQRILAFALLGLAVIARPTALALLPVYLWYTAPALPRPRPWAHGAGLALLALLPALVVTGMNLRVEKDPVFVASQGGVNLYAGNHAGATGRSVEIPELGGIQGSWVDFVEASRDFAEREAGEPLSSAGVSRWWTTRTLDWMIANAGDAAALTGRKILYLVNGYETPSNRDPYSARPFPLSILLWAVPGLAFPLGLLLPVALAALVAGWRRSEAHRELRLLAGWCVLYGAAVVLFFVNARFRLGLVPALILLAAWGLSRWRELVRPFPLTVFVIALVVANASWLDARAGNPAQDRANLGAALARAGQTAEARSAFEEAYALEPSARHAYLLGQAWTLERNPLEARRWFTRAREGGATPAMLADMAASLADLGLNDEAVAYLTEATRQDPGLERAAVELGMRLSTQGRTDEAIRVWEQALQRHPVSYTLHYNLAIAYGRAGRLEEARRSVTRCLEIRPGDEDAQNLRPWLDTLD